MTKIDLERELKKAIKQSGLSLNEIARRSGLPSATICRFVNGQRTLTLRTGSKVAAIFGMRFTESKMKGK